MKKIRTHINYLLVIAITSAMPQILFAHDTHKVSRFMMDYPRGHNMILVTSLGEATFLQNASPKVKVIKKGVFFASDLYVKFKPYLHINLPKVDQLESIYGSVKLSYDDGCVSNYLIYEVNELTESVFSIASNNLIARIF
ncbi:MAG: hypothetical protein ACJA0M_001405 [Chitinophagales bacterium]|jgi:hypothetical protein